ncbi:MAG: hypothetical protein KDD48_00150 [Bdellovibrionales bacterium]|nr:hypothetical protein [Bdellovibrionales bacterium]
MLHFRQTHGIRLGLSELVGGSPRTMADLIAVLSTLPVTPTRIILSKIQILMANEDSSDFENHMRTHYVGPACIEALKKYSAVKGAQVRLFTKMAILLVQEVFRQHHDIKKSGPAEVEYVIPKISEAILIANDICNTVTSKSDKNMAEPDNYATFALPEMLFNYSDQFRYAIGRSYLIYEGLKERCRTEYPDDFFDVDAFFKEKLKIGFDDYFFAIFALYSQWSFSFKDLANQSGLIDPTTWIESPLLRTRINNILALFEDSWEQPQTISDVENLEIIREVIYENFHLRKSPLLKIPEGILCGSLQHIMSKCWNGPYYEIIDRGNECQKDLFFRFLGRTIEMYVQGLLKDAFRHKFKQITSTSGNPIADAAVYIKSSWCLLFEVKAKRPTREMTSSGDAPAEMQAVAKMAFEGLQQLNNRIADFRATGFRGRITPILVTGGLFPINSLLWKHYLHKVESLPMMSDLEVDLPQFMNLESIEILTALKQICGITDLLREKLTDSWKAESLQTFLFSYYFPKYQIIEPLNKTCESLYKDRMAALIRALFPNKASDFPADNRWRPVFSRT